jgi:hypothetical protein
MAVQSNLDGTRRDEFTIGKGELNGICRTLSGETALYDPISGQATIAEMLAGGGSADFNKILTSRTTGEVLVSRNTGNVVTQR